MTWNPNWITSEGKGKLLKPALNELRGALNERGVAVDRNNDPGEIFTNDIIPSDWFFFFQSGIDDILDRYANHTDSSGDWTGQDDIPLWTEADMLTAIGDAERIPAPTDPLISARWMFQQYKILNLLRWVRKVIGYMQGSQDRIGRGSSSISPEIAVNLAIIQLESTPFSPTSASLSVKNRTRFNSFSNEYECRIDQSIGKLETDFDYTSVDLQSSIDFYLSGAGNNLYGNFSPVFHPLQGKLNTAITTPEGFGERDTGLLAHDQFDQFDLNFDVGSIGTNFVNTIIGRGRAAEKFDGENGFQFRDW